MSRPYTHQVEFVVPAGALDSWLPHARNHLSVLARQEGLWSARLYCELERDPGPARRFIAIATWSSRDHAQRALASTEVKLAPIAAGLAGGVTPRTREFELIDHVFGRRGPSAFPTRGGFAQHLYTHIPAVKRDAWEPYRRNCGSIMARQTGVVSYELLQDLGDPEVVLVLREYEDRSYGGVMKGAAADYRPNREIHYATRPALDLALYEGARAVEYTDCEVCDGVIGPGGLELYGQFMESLEPV